MLEVVMISESSALLLTRRGQSKEHDSGENITHSLGLPVPWRWSFSLSALPRVPQQDVAELGLRERKTSVWEVSRMTRIKHHCTLVDTAFGRGGNTCLLGQGVCHDNMVRIAWLFPDMVCHISWSC